MIRMIGIVIMAAGLFVMVGAGLHMYLRPVQVPRPYCEWFWARPRNKVWVAPLGQRGAWVAYGIVGLAALVPGALITAGVIAI